MSRSFAGLLAKQGEMSSGIWQNRSPVIRGPQEKLVRSICVLASRVQGPIGKSEAFMPKFGQDKRKNRK